MLFGKIEHGSQKQCIHNTKLDIKQMFVRETLKVGSFCVNTFKNTTLKSVLKKSFPVFLQPEMSWIQGMFQPFSEARWYFVTIILGVSFMTTLNEAICTIKAQKLQQCEVRRPGQTLCCLQREARHLGKHCSPVICHQLWKPAPTWSLLSAHKRKCLKLI